MWTATVEMLLRLQGGDGGPFANLMNALLHAEAPMLGISLRDIRITARSTVPDGGVDAIVEYPADANTVGSTSWFEVPTVWQYKGTRYAEISADDLKTEINKAKVKELIKNGYGYRFCICDDPPPVKVVEWENLLNIEAQCITPTAFPVYVLTASRIVEWVNKYVAIYLRFFAPTMVDLLTLDTWKIRVRSKTNTYVDIPDWKPLAEQIKNHTDFSIIPPGVVIPVLGAAGVGKTRLCFETLYSEPNLKAKVIYTEDAQRAKAIAAELINLSQKQAVIVVDECSLSTRVKLEDMLLGVRERVRVIAIDNSGTRKESDARQPWLDKIPNHSVLEILEKNYPNVSEDRRRLYAGLAKGFIRIAADLCQYHDKDALANSSYLNVPRLEDYLQSRLNDQQRECLEALAIVKRVGAKEDVRNEIETLCAYLKLNSLDIDKYAHQIKDGPGFIEVVGRYLAVTPWPVAQLAFQNGYRKWIAPDSKARILNFPSILLDKFCECVAEYGSEEVRREVGEVFRSELMSLNGSDLANRNKVERIVNLIEIDPMALFPLFRRVIDNASEAELAENTGEFRERWGPRRDVVSLCERIVRFPEYFRDAEAILWRLAQVETEPNIGNNATATWRSLFRIFLSGTNIHFSDRIKILEKRLRHDNQQFSAIAFDAFGGILDSSVSRIVGRDVIAGRIAPPQWRPADNMEHGDCIRLSVEILGQIVHLTPAWRTDLALKVLQKHLGILIYSGFGTELRSLYASVHLSPSQETQLRVSLLDQLHYSGRRQNRVLSEATKNLIQEWIVDLAPKDISARVTAVIAIDPWHYGGGDRKKEKAKWEAEAAVVATEIINAPECLDTVLELLNSPEARSAGVLAFALGKADGNAALCASLSADAAKRKSATILRWYFLGLLNVNTKHVNLVNDVLDSIENTVPKVAYEIALTLGIQVNAVKRILYLVDQKRITPQYLRGFIQGGLVCELAPKEFQILLERLMPPPISERDAAIATAIDLLHARLNRENAFHEIADCPALRDISFAVLEHASQMPGKDGEWVDTLKALSALDIPRAASIAALGLFSEERIMQGEGAIEVLVYLASLDVSIVMDEIGRVMLDPLHGKWSYFGKYDSLFAALPPKVVIDWLKRVGVEGARRIARHLPPPSLDNDNEPVVPELTEATLEMFESDERTFKEFCCGVHSFQSYWGDIASKYDAEGKKAECFLNHRLRRIREWAQLERDYMRREAAEERRISAEQ